MSVISSVESPSRAVSLSLITSYSRPREVPFQAPPSDLLSWAFVSASAVSESVSSEVLSFPSTLPHLYVLTHQTSFHGLPHIHDEGDDNIHLTYLC